MRVSSFPPTRDVTRCNRVSSRDYIHDYTRFFLAVVERYICEVRINFERVSSLFYRLKCHMLNNHIVEFIERVNR